MSDESNEQFAVRYLDKRIDAIAERLRDLARRVERSKVAGLERPPASYGNVASEVQNEVLWGLANLHLDQLTVAAANADRGRTDARDQPVATCVCCTLTDCGDRRGHINVVGIENTEWGPEKYDRCNCGRDWPCEKAAAG
jgi:hypothetical protein